MQQNNKDHQLVGKSFLDGKERLDIKDIQSDQFLVRRTKDHAFLKDKKSVKDETWDVEKFKQNVANGTFKEIPTYAYTTTHLPYEINEINLRNNGLISAERTNTGMTLTFDHPVNKTDVKLSNLTPTPETAAKINAPEQTNSVPQNTPDHTKQKLDSQQSQQNTKNEMTPMMKQFLDLKSKHPDALLLFRCGDFYETYQQDARKASQILGITLTKSSKTLGPDGKPIEMAGFPHHTLDTYLPKLIRAGQRVAICDQLELPKRKISQQESKPEQQNTTPIMSAGNTTDNKTQQLIDNITKLLDGKKGMDILTATPIETKTSKGVPFTVERVAYNNNNEIRLYGEDIEGKERSLPLNKADEKTLSAISQRMQDAVQNDLTASASKQKLIDTITEIIKDKRGVGVSPEKPIMARTSFGAEFPVDMVAYDKQGNIRLSGIDFMNRERSVPLQRTDEKTLQEIVNHLNSSLLRSTDKNRTTDLPEKDNLTQNHLPKHNERNPQQVTQPTTPENDNQTSRDHKREERKIAALSKTYDDAKVNHPDEMVFIRQRDPMTKKLMYQTFGEDAQNLAQNISPSTELKQHSIKGVERPLVTIRQDDIATIKADLMKNDVKPVIINAKGVEIKNDHSLAYSPDTNVRNVAVSQQPPKNHTTDIPADQIPNQPNQHPTTKTADAKQNTQLTLNFDTNSKFQYKVKRNSHYPGIFNIRLYIDGEQAGSHRLLKDERDLWKQQKIPIEDLMVKYFGKELGISKFPNLTYFKGDDEQQTVQQTDASPEKIKNYDARAQFHKEIANQNNGDEKEILVMLKMKNNDGGIFYQTFNENAALVADMMDRNILSIGNNNYISLSEKDMKKLEDLMKSKIVVADYNPHDYSQKQHAPAQTTNQNANTQNDVQSVATPSQQDLKNLPDIKPNTKVEYVISPIANGNKDTNRQQEYSIAVSADGISLGSKILPKQTKDLIDQRPTVISNVINQLFEKELKGVTVNFKQVHRPAVSEELWNNRDMGNGIKLDYSKVANKEMTAKINGVTFGPKKMIKQDLNDFFDRARPLTDIVANVFRDELQSLKNNTGQQNAPKLSGKQTLALWQMAHEDNNPQKLAFIQLEGKYGTFYKTFGEDAKNMSKVTNRNLKVQDIEEQKNLIYAAIAGDQIQTVFKQLRSKGFLPFAINAKGEPVSISPEQKTNTPKSISLEDGRKVDDISLRNTGDKWIMSVKIDGIPMPQQEISGDDAKTFKQGQQTMADILTKYFKNDPNQQQDNKHGLGR